MLQGNAVVVLSLLSLLILAPLHTHTLTLNSPVPGTGFTGILSNGTASVSWLVAPGDPSFMTLEIQNNLTLDSWEFARNVDVSLGNITRQLDNVSGNEFYFMQAVAVGNLSHVLAEGPMFTVNGIAVTTTNPLQGLPTSTIAKTLTSTPTTITSALHTTDQATSTQAINVSASPTVTDRPTTTPAASQKNRTGPIAGGVIGGLAFLALLIVVFIFYRRRRNLAAHPTLVPLTQEQSYTQPLDKSGRLAQVVGEKAAAQRQRDQLQIDLEARNRAQLPGSMSNASQAESEARLRRQVELMGERIRELEAQQRELEAYDGRLFGEDRSQPPPDYSVTTGSRSIA